MINLSDFILFARSFLDSYQFLLTVIGTSFIFKLFIIYILSKQDFKNQPTRHSLFFLICVLIGSIVIDSAWILKILKILFFTQLDYRIVLFWLRIAWGFSIIQYQALALFIESLLEQKNIFNTKQKFFLPISIFFSLFFFILAICNFNYYEPNQRPYIEFMMEKAIAIYTLFPIMLSSFFSILYKLRSNNLPRILAKQLKILLLAVITPLWLSDFLQVFPLENSPTWITNSNTFVSFSNFFLAYAIYFCSRKIMGLRFLNITDHVQSPIKHDFMDSLKGALEQLGHVTNVQELRHITQNFFKDSFKIPLNRTHLYIRNNEKHDFVDINSKAPSLVETFIATHEEKICDLLLSTKILIFDEIAFSNFYSESKDCQSLLNFLETINADIFLPIYENNKLVAYIIVDRHARLEEFYSNVERDEMLVFASYLGNIINLLQNRNFDTLLAKEKNLQEELYHKHQEINQYKESIRSFVRNSKEHDIGIIFYKNRRFTFGNQAAKELINININVQAGHPLTKAIKQIAQHVEQYKSPKSTFAKDSNGNTIVLSAVPHLEQNNVIITTYYPRLSDILRKQLELVHDPSEWDYLLYLETTKSGKLINKLIPNAGEQLLQFKIDLLKVALSKKAILLDIADQDLMPTVELLHHINLRESLKILNIEPGHNKLELAIKLFGVNPIFGHKDQESPLLETLNQNGTLFIKNIHLIDLELQEYLAEFIRYGFYRIYKSEQKEPSNVRIICSSNQDLQTLVREGKFSEQLFNELNKTTLSMPSLITLPEQELQMLADGFTQQAVQTQTFQNLLILTNKDKNKLTTQRPSSLQELKIKVQKLLVAKSEANEIFQETQFDPAYHVNDPELVQAARLGKHALKDQKTMILLWQKFKNQNKIAAFLGVNRSSVNRRCKEYDLN